MSLYVAYSCFADSHYKLKKKKLLGLYFLYTCLDDLFIFIKLLILIWHLKFCVNYLGTVKKGHKLCRLGLQFVEAGEAK